MYIVMIKLYTSTFEHTYIRTVSPFLKVSSPRINFIIAMTEPPWKRVQKVNQSTLRVHRFIYQLTNYTQRTAYPYICTSRICVETKRQPMFLHITAVFSLCRKTAFFSWEKLVSIFLWSSIQLFSTLKTAKMHVRVVFELSFFLEILFNANYFYTIIS